MTEPLLFALCALAVLLMTRWALDETVPSLPHAAGWTMVAACLTRYEAWPIVGVLIPTAAWARWRRGSDAQAVLRATLGVVRYPIGAVLFFLILSRVTVGEWFVTGGFYVPDETLLGHPRVVAEKILEGVTALSGLVFVRTAAVATLVLVAAAIFSRQSAAALAMLALMAAVALPFSAFISGHPFRVRYEVPLVVAFAGATGMAIGLCGRAGPWLALAAATATAWGAHPFDPSAPMIVEAQLDRANGQGRQRVSHCLARDYRGESIVASMGSLAHYMQELSHHGLAIRDFLHEGNHPIWDAALEHGPAPFAGWVLIEEVAEGGDLIAGRMRADPRFLDGFDRVCEGGNVALYRRRAR
jgi:hypothetical protein